MKMWKVYDNNNNDDNHDNGQNVIRKAHLSLRLRWAINIRPTNYIFVTSFSQRICMGKGGPWKPSTSFPTNNDVTTVHWLSDITCIKLMDTHINIIRIDVILPCIKENNSWMIICIKKVRIIYNNMKCLLTKQANREEKQKVLVLFSVFVF